MPRGRNKGGGIMKKIAFFDTKPYDKESFERQNNGRYAYC